MKRWMMVGAVVSAGGAMAQPAQMDTAAAFGAREAISNVTLSPDGTTIAYRAALGGQASALKTLPISGEGNPKTVLAGSPGQPERLGRCNWASIERLVCTIWTISRDAEYGLYPTYRLFGVNAPAGGNVQLLSQRENSASRGAALSGGNVIAWLPDEHGTVLMARPHLAEDRTGSLTGSSKQGLGVDRIDTKTLKAVAVEQPRSSATEFLSDAQGNVRIMGLRDTKGLDELDSGVIHYSYRQKGSRTWETFGNLDYVNKTGFNPYSIDSDRNVVYGFSYDNGRQVLYSVSLDGALTKTKIVEHTTVDIDGLVTIGPRARVVGATYATDRRSSVYFDPEMEKLTAQLHRALPKQPLIDIVGATPDESKLLVVASSDNDPGVYYVFDKAKKDLHILFPARPELLGRQLATVKSISYPAGDGTMIPGYLTLPPGKETARGLPAIVMPHGGPEARDEWGFDWLAQYYAAQGYAVLQPNFRGSAGFGLAWFQKNGFQSWKIAVGDVLDAGRWLVKEGYAAPSKLAILGWSYGGYAALQSAVLDPAVFKAVVAIAPVTDLVTLREEDKKFSTYQVTSDYIGHGPHLREGSPAQNADKIKVPVLLVHGTDDLNVGYPESKLMDSRLSAANVPHELITYQGLDNQLDDSTARADMLRRSDAFLRKALGLPPVVTEPARAAAVEVQTVPHRGS